MRVFVTGASGLLGLNLALEAKQAYTVFGQVNRHALRSIPGLTILKGDLLTPGTAERLLDQAQPDWVIHCAALAELDACEADPLRAQELNTAIPAQLARLVARGGARFLQVSTDAVFDGLRGNYTEADVPNPLSVYARTKLDAERAVLEANPQAIVARVNLYGWSLTGKRSLAEFFFNNLSAGRPVMGFTDVFFCPLLANELGAILLEMLAAGLSGLYHVVNSQALSKYDFGAAIARRFSLDEHLIQPRSVAEAGLKAARSPNLTLRADKLSTALGRPLPSFSPGLERFYTLYQQGYPQFIRSL